ncbi:MAG: rRNA ((966)-N(2))-methyltransferase RsmD [Actinomycetota bacterium]
MTRIIAGAIGSLQLKPAAKATRPTSDRVKESLFAKLDAMGVIEGAKVLDLFAGTGALGLESASRGAVSVDLVERDRVAFGLLEQNVKSSLSSFEKQGISTKIQAHNRDAQRYIKSSAARFDLVFVDPPYDFPNSELEHLLGSIAERLSEEGLVIVERSSRSAQLDFEALELQSTKTYGDTAVWIYEKP